MSDWSEPTLLVFSCTYSYAFPSQGGMKAVVWTDVFQSGIMVAGLLAIVIQVLKVVIKLIVVRKAISCI